MSKITRSRAAKSTAGTTGRRSASAGRRARKPKSPAADHVVRFSVSLPPDLAEDLDDMVAERGLPSRSAAVADMVRHQLIRHRTALGTAIVSGTITVVYDNTGNNVRTRITRIQREYLKEVISSQHVFLEDDHSLEVLLVQGPGETLKALCDALTACRGVEQAELAVTAALLPPLH